MAAGYVCVAGLDGDGRHVRPVVEGRWLTTDLLGANGGPFEIAATVDLGPTRPVGANPEVEDYAVQPQHIRQVAPPDFERLWARLVENAELKLIDIFGHDLTSRGHGAVVPLGAGARSLGTLMSGYRPRVSLRDGRIRCHVVDPDFGELDVSVTDIRLYTVGGNGWQPDADKVAEVSYRVLRPRTRTFPPDIVGSSLIHLSFPVL